MHGAIHNSLEEFIVDPNIQPHRYERRSEKEAAVQIVKKGYTLHPTFDFIKIALPEKLYDDAGNQVTKNNIYLPEGAVDHQAYEEANMLFPVEEFGPAALDMMVGKETSFGVGDYVMIYVSKGTDPQGAQIKIPSGIIFKDGDGREKALLKSHEVLGYVTKEEYEEDLQEESLTLETGLFDDIGVKE